MKSSVIKKITVKVSPQATFTFDIDSTVYDDVYFEAATRAIERIRQNPSVMIKPVIECYEQKDEKNPNGLIVCNSYWLLVNAGLYSKAELLREKFLAQFEKDLAKEPLRGRKPTKSK
jgi:hypothetical protein